MDMNRIKVAVLGTGCVGLPLCILLNKVGHEVTGLDTNGFGGKNTSIIIDQTILQKENTLNGIRFTTEPSDIQDNDVYIICVPTTPITEKNKRPGLGYVKSVRTMLQQYAKPESLIILESPVGIGDTRWLFNDMNTKGFHIANGLRRIIPLLWGNEDNKNNNNNNNNKPQQLQQGQHQDCAKVIVGGLTPKATELAYSFYSTIFDCVMAVENCEHSESARLVENICRTVRASMVHKFTWANLPIVY